jgi:uronate dehydrogenase
MEKARLLITGVQGRIGGILKRALDASYDIYGLDNIFPASDSRTFAADISDSQQVMHVFKSCDPIHYVIHLAADPDHEASWDSACRNNIQGTWNVFEAANLHGVRRIAF